VVEFSVVVPAYNAAATLGECLAALRSQTMPRARYEIIVVDDGSADATAQVAEAAGVHVLRQPNQGPAVARNLGVRQASGDIVLFTDADCVPAANWLEEMVAPFADPEIVGSKGVYRTRQPGLVPRFVQVEYQERYDQMERAHYIDFVDTYAAAYRRQVFLQHNGFDTSFPTASVEDQELSFRLAKRGYKMVFVPGAVVYHRHPPTLAAYVRRKYKTAYWKALVLRLHPDKAVRDSHTPGSLKVQMGLVCIFVPALVLAAGLGIFGPVLAAMLLLVVASFAPFMLKAWRRDRTVALVSPVLLTARAAALSAGLLRGMWDALRQPGRMAPGRV